MNRVSEGGENCDHLYMTHQVVSKWRIEGKS